MPQKILIVRFSSIGDIVLTTPVIRCLKVQTGAEIHFLTKAPFAGILEANPYVDKVITIDKDLGEVAHTLVQGSYDGCIDLHGNLRTLELKLKLKFGSWGRGASTAPIPTPHPDDVRGHADAGPRQQPTNPARNRPPRITTFDKLNLQKFLLTKLKIDRMPDLHIVDRYLAAAAPFGVVNDGKGLEYFIPEKDRVDLEVAGILPNYLAFVIGAAHATKRLTEPQMREFCEKLRHPIVLLGGPAEKEVGDRVARDLPHVTNVCGGYNLAGSADLVRQAGGVITHDTGLMHIAAAFQKPIVSVWGNTVPALGMYPYLPGQQGLEKKRRQEVMNLSCRPCSKIGFAECPKGHFRCITDQSADELVSACERILSDLR